MIKRSYAVVAVLLLFAALTPVALAAEGVVGNGGFETPAHGGGYATLAAGDTSMGPWEIGGAGVESVGTLWEADQGSYSIDLNSTAPGSIAQNIETISGKTYTLTFAFSAVGSEGPAIKTMDVYWDGSLIKSFSVDSTDRTFSDMRWTHETLQLTAAGSTGRLEFRSTTDASRAGPALDNVKFTSGAVPPRAEIGVSSFDAGLNSLVSVGFDQVANNVFVYGEFGDEIFEYTQSGSRVGSGIPVPAKSNDIDLDFSSESFSVGGDTVSANALLVPNGDAGRRLDAIDKDDGSVVASMQMPGSSSVGGSYHAARDTFLSYSYAERKLWEFDPDDGSVASEIVVDPADAPPFGSYYGDVEVDPSTGNLLVVSSSQNVIRHLSPTGEWLGDLDVFNEDDASDPLQIEQMSGLAIDDSTRDVWLSSRTGQVWQLSNIWNHFSTALPCESDPDALCGDDGDNTIQGTSGDDTIYAGAGDDVIDGGGGKDTIIGGAGNDVLAGGGQNDRLSGGPGNDIISGDASTAGFPNVLGRSAFISLLQQQAPPPGADVLQGGGGQDAVLGGGGADKVLGQAGNDELEGNEGPDLLKGGGGVNDFDGGPGKDHCVLKNKEDETESCEKKTRNFTRNFWPAPVPGVSVSSRESLLQGSFTPETLELDSHDNDDDGAAGPVSTSASLESGVVYIVTVDGTFSTWDESTWDNPGACGTPESQPEKPSPGTTNGPVSSDAEFLLSEPAWGGQNCNDPIPRHDGGPFQIDVGSGFVHQEPIGDEPSSPSSDHTYSYRVTGRGVPAQFELVEDPTSDNYGILTITVEAEPSEDDPPPQCGDAGAICGGSEDEELQGTPEDEFIFGGGGDDEIDGGGGNDVIVGASGNDVLAGGPGKDKITGGSGKDRIVGDSPRGSNSAMRSGVIASQDAPAADQLAGGGGNDSVLGGGGGDQVAGGSGQDRIFGEAGNDKLKGDAGNDLLKGGGGVNDFNGGPGRDHCVLNNKRDDTQSCEKKTRNFTRNFFPLLFLRVP